MNSKRYWSSMRRISLLERGMVLAGPLLQRGPISIRKQRCAWMYFQVRLLPQLLLATTSRRAGFVCGQGLKKQLSWCRREDKISPCSPLEVLCYTDSIAETQDKRMIFHTPGTYLVQRLELLKDQQLTYLHPSCERSLFFRPRLRSLPRTSVYSFLDLH